MKRLASCILVVLLICMAIPAMAEEDITGDWYLKTLKMGDEEYDAASIGYAITMTLNEDGSASMTLPAQEPMAGTWALEDNRIIVTVGDSPAEGIVSEGTIVLTEDGMDMIFTREVVETVALAEVKAAESAEEFYGDWTSVYVEMEGIVMEISVVGMGTPKMTVSETGLTFGGDEDEALTIILSMNKMDAPVFAEGKLAISAAEDALNPDMDMTAELLEDGMLKLTMVSDDSPMILYFVPAEVEDGAVEITGEKYVDGGSSFAIKTADLPANYTCIPYDRFAAGFKRFVDGTLTTSSTYEDVAKAFGDDGIKMTGIVYEGYGYYGWYSDKDYTSDTKVYVLVTFKAKDGQLFYYAYSAMGITPQDVK